MPKFINPANVMAQVGLQVGATVADFGSGSGFFTVAAAGMVGSDGIVYAVDIMPDKLGFTQSIAKQTGFRNVTVLQADLTLPLTGIPQNSCDLVILANIIHLVGDKRAMLFKNAYASLKTGGKLLVVEWKRAHSPFGPPFESRVAESELEADLQTHGFRKPKPLEVDGYHYALLSVK